MRIMRISRFILAAAACVLAYPAIAQTTGAAPATGIGLTAEHKRIIYRDVGADGLPSAPAAPIVIGEGIPESPMLIEMPIEVKDKIGVLRDFKFAKLSDESIVIVDPARRQVVDLVRKEDAQ